MGINVGETLKEIAQDARGNRARAYVHALVVHLMRVADQIFGRDPDTGEVYLNFSEDFTSPYVDHVGDTVIDIPPRPHPLTIDDVTGQLSAAPFLCGCRVTASGDRFIRIEIYPEEIDG